MQAPPVSNVPNACYSTSNGKDTNDKNIGVTTGLNRLTEDLQLTEATTNKLTHSVPIEQRCVTLSEFTKSYCHTFTDYFQACPQENCVKFLINANEIDTDDSDKEDKKDENNKVIPNPISAEEFNAFDRQLATNQQMTGIRNYINNHSSVMINNQAYEIEEIPEKAPILYQYFSKNKDSKILEDYVAIFENNCEIESERETVIMVDDYYTNRHDKSVLEGLADKYDNVSLFKFSQLSDIAIGDVKIERSVDDQGIPYFSFKDHGGIPNSGIPWHYFDLARFMALARHNEIFKQSQSDGISGCLYIDFDYVLKKEIGSVKCAGGIAPFVMEKINPSFFGNALYTLKIENSLIGVSRHDHPAIVGSLKRFINSCGDDEMMPITPYTAYEEYLCEYFNHCATDHTKLQMNKKLILGKTDCIAAYYLTDKTVLKGAAEKSLNLGYGVTDAWKKKITFPVNLSMVPDISKLLGVSTWKDR